MELPGEIGVVIHSTATNAIFLSRAKMYFTLQKKISWIFFRKGIQSRWLIAIPDNNIVVFFHLVITSALCTFAHSFLISIT